MHLRRNHPGNRSPSLDFHFDPQLVAGTHRAAKFCPLDAREHHYLIVTIFHFREQQRASGLRNGFDDEDAGHDRQAGEMAIEERFVNRDVLNRYDALFGFQFQHAIDQQ